MAEVGALEGIRVVDLTTVVMGPYATQILGDMGADVIKVEPLGGDPGRHVGARPHPDLSGLALNIHRNKRSLALDLRLARGQEAMGRLLDTAALFVTNLRPTSLRHMGISYEQVRAGRPGLVYCEAHGYPSDTAAADDPAYDDVIQAASGLAALFAATGGPPALMPSVIVDKICGLAIANAVLGALHHRAVTGAGQRVEVPMFDVALAFNLVEHLDAAAPVPPMGPPGYRRVLSPHRRPYRSADGWVAMLPYLAKDWRRLWAALGREDLVAELEPLSDGEVMARAPEMYKELGQLAPGRSTAQWLEFCAAIGVAASAIYTLGELAAGPEGHRGVLQAADHPVVGPYQHIAPPARMSVTPLSLRRPAPLVGEHTACLLAELGYSEAEVEELCSAGVAGSPGAPRADMGGGAGSPA